MNALLPESDFRLYAVSSRFPQKLAAAVPWRRLQDGVYECRRGTNEIRVVVLGELPKHKHNADLLMLSDKPELQQFGIAHFEQRSSSTTSLVFQLTQGFKQEGMAMPYTMADFHRDFEKEHFSLEKRLEGLTPEQRLQGLSPEEVLKALSPEQRLQGLSPEEVLKALSPEQIERYLEQRKQQATSRKRKKKK